MANFFHCCLICIFLLASSFTETSRGEFPSAVRNKAINIQSQQSKIPVDENKTPTHLFVWIDVDRETVGDQSIHLRIDFANHQEVPFTVKEINISHAYLAGFNLVHMLPEPFDTDPSGDTTTFCFEHAIEAGGTWRIEMVLKAAKTGVYSGDIDVWSDDAFVFSTVRAQTVILPDPKRLQTFDH